VKAAQLIRDLLMTSKLASLLHAQLDQFFRPMELALDAKTILTSPKMEETACPLYAQPDQDFLSMVNVKLVQLTPNFLMMEEHVCQLLATMTKF
jgi:hypothetical protein